MSLRAATAAHPQVASLAYSFNVQASMMNMHTSQAFDAFPQNQRWPPIQVPSLSSFQTIQQRPPYSKEMQFFIMFARIYKEQSWREIEDNFEKTFKQRRCQNGLSIVYSRVRNRWGMQQALRSGPDFHNYNPDIAVLETRARDLPRHFLRQIGYPREEDPLPAEVMRVENEQER